MKISSLFLLLFGLCCSVPNLLQSSRDPDFMGAPPAGFDILSPFMNGFLKQHFGLISGTWSMNSLYRTYIHYVKLHNNYSRYYTYSGIFLIFLSLFSNTGGFAQIVSLFARTGFFLSRFILILVCLSTVLFFLLINRNLWQEALLDIFFGPLILLACSCIALLIFDPNFPVWNRLLGSIGFIFISGLSL